MRVFSRQRVPYWEYLMRGMNILVLVMMDTSIEARMNAENKERTYEETKNTARKSRLKGVTKSILVHPLEIGAI